MATPVCLCEECGQPYKSLAHHLYYNPECEIDEDLPELVENDHSESDDELDLEVPPPSSCTPSASVRAQIAVDLSMLRNKLGLGDSDIHLLKKVVQGWHDELTDEVVKDLQPYIRKGHSTAQDAVAAVARRKVFTGMATAAQEARIVDQVVPPLKAREVRIDGDRRSVVGSFRVADIIERKLQHDRAFRQRVLQRSDHYKSGDGFQREPTKLDDIADGVKARYHPKLMRPAQPGEEHHVRMAAIFQCDDIEVRAAHCR